MCQSEEGCAFSLKNQWKEKNTISACDCWKADFKVIDEAESSCVNQEEAYKSVLPKIPL